MDLHLISTFLALIVFSSLLTMRLPWSQHYHLSPTNPLLLKALVSSFYICRMKPHNLLKLFPALNYYIKLSCELSTVLLVQQK